MTKSRRRSHIARVLEFFNQGDDDEVRAVLLLLKEQGHLDEANKSKEAGA